MSKQSCPSDDEEMKRVGDLLIEDIRRLVRRQFAQFSILTPTLSAFKINPRVILIEEMEKFIRGDEYVHKGDGPKQ